MKKRNFKLFIEDILQAIDKIEDYSKKLSFNQFSRKEIVVDAIMRNLEIIGEASRNIPNEMRKNNSQIPWKRMIGLRNIAIHEYFGIDLEIIWEIITKNLPETKPLIRKLLKKM